MILLKMVVSKSDQDRAQLRDDAKTINTEPLLSHLRCDLWLVQLALVSVREEVPLASPSKGKRCVQKSRKKIRTLQGDTLTKTKTFKIKYQGSKEFHYILFNRE